MLKDSFGSQVCIKSTMRSLEIQTGCLLSVSASCLFLLMPLEVAFTCECVNLVYVCSGLAPIIAHICHGECAHVLNLLRFQIFTLASSFTVRLLFCRLQGCLHGSVRVSFNIF